MLRCVRMSALSRIGVAIDSDLLEEFDRLIARRGYTNRSEAFRDLIRDELLEQTGESPESHVVGTISLVYNHHVRMLNEKLTGIQHDYHRSILSTLHVHLDHSNCLEVLVVKGKSGEVRRVADVLISTKGVKHGRLTISTSAAELE
jgi:CopG family transcriptional regulator, nickel-responsive regulator